ncbi:MAG: peptide ABC transporter ATP-binding protein, partial [Pseudomonadota bacterium]
RVELYERFEFIKQAEGVSALLVTHDLREARRLAEYLIILHQGAIQQQGATSEVLAEPATAYVRSLVESQLA